MNRSEEQIVIVRPKETVATDLENIIIRGGLLRQHILDTPPASSDELLALVAYRNGRFHVWIRSIEQEFRRSFSPALKLLDWLRNLHHQQWQYHVPWQDRAKALPEDINTHLEFLKDIRGRVLHNYEEAKYDKRPYDLETERRLKEIMTQSFNINELRGLTHDLGIPFENLESKTKDGLILDIIDYQKRRNQLFELIEQVKAQRPILVWAF